MRAVMYNISVIGDLPGCQRTRMNVADGAAEVIQLQELHLHNPCCPRGTF